MIKLTFKSKLLQLFPHAEKQSKTQPLKSIHQCRLKLESEIFDKNEILEVVH